MSISSTLVDRAHIQFHEAAEAAAPVCRLLLGDYSGLPHEWMLRGPLIRPDERHFTSPATLVGIRLRPGVAFLLSGTPAHAMIGRRVGLTGHASFHDLVADGLAPDTPGQCIDVLQRFLLRRLAHAALHVTVATALHEIERQHGGVRVPDLAAHCGVSPRHLHRLMRIWVGYGPKSYASIIRFQATLHEMEDTPGRTAAALAAENGFFDQAHLTVDVSRYGGATPGRLAAAGVADFSKTRCNDLP